MRRNPLLFVNSALMPMVFLLLAVETERPGPAGDADLVSAVALTALWSSTVWMSGGVLRRERTYGTLARCVSGSHSPYLVLLGKSAGATAYSVGAIVASIAITMLALRMPLDLRHPAWIVIAVLLMMASAIALGALVSCLFLVTRNGLIWSGALMYPVFALGGLLIPPSALPSWVRWVSALLSLRWIHTFVVGTSAGTTDWGPLTIALGETVGYFVIARWAYLRSVNAARARGNLDFT